MAYIAAYLIYVVWKRTIKNVAWNVVGEVSPIAYFLWFALHHSRSANDRLLLVRLYIGYHKTMNGKSKSHHQ